MHFQLFSHVPWPEKTEPKQMIDNIIDEFCLGEQLGFQGGWMAEHHFSRYGLGSASLLVHSNIAARTSTFRLGTAVIIPPLHNPVKLAEDTATLDLLSNGRFDAGFGRGSAGYEYSGYNIDSEESQGRFQEAIRMVEGLWTTRDYSFQGKYYQIEHADLVPPPVQKPHPPIYIAATRTAATQEFVASTGHPSIIGVVLDTEDALTLCRNMIELSKKAGNVMTMDQIPFFRYFHVAETEEQAKKNTRASLDWNLDMIQWRRTFSRGSEVYQNMDDFRKTRTETPPSYEYLYENRAIIGTPDQCIAKIKRLEDQGVANFGCNFSFGGMQQSKVTESMELFAKEVMPAFG